MVIQKKVNCTWQAYHGVAGLMPLCLCVGFRWQNIIPKWPPCHPTLGELTPGCLGEGFIYIFFKKWRLKKSKTPKEGSVVGRISLWLALIRRGMCQNPESGQSHSVPCAGRAWRGVGKDGPHKDEGGKGGREDGRGRGRSLLACWKSRALWALM